MAKEFQEQGVTSAHADANTKNLEREQIMQDFRNGIIKVLCNVDLISEGFDVPDCTCVILARPTDSLVLFMQQAMRSMRYQPNKKALIIDHVGNYARHGLPDTKHNWKKYFNGIKKRSNKQDANVIGLTSCNECFGVYDNTLPACPECGHENETVAERSELKKVDAELTDIKPFKVDYTLKRYSKENISQSDLETLEDYYLYAKANNYKETWIKFNYPACSRMNFPQFYSEIKPLREKYKH
nr:helicase-related protein [Staphylococcus xylosus]